MESKTNDKTNFRTHAIDKKSNIKNHENVSFKIVKLRYNDKILFNEIYFCTYFYDLIC